MAKWQCNLCSHIYDEDSEPKKWDDIPEDRACCAICGSPKNCFSPLHTENSNPQTVSKKEESSSKYECALCTFLYDEARESTAWKELQGDWSCPVCGSSKENFFKKEVVTKPEPTTVINEGVDEEYLSEWRRQSDDFETHMADIHKISIGGKSVIEPMRSRLPVFSWDDVLVLGAQLFKLPLNKSQPVSTRTVIGPGATHPMVIDTPLFVSHMSFGALSREAKLALSKGSAMAKTAMCSGEGGILPASLAVAHKYIFEYVPNKYSVSDEYLQQVAAVEIKIGQSAKPGMGGHLPGHKVTREIAKIRGKREGKDIISPSHFPDILTKDDLKKTVDSLRTRSGGKPIGIKLAAGRLEADLEVALYAGIDFITIDGRAGGTGAAPKVVKNSAAVPTLFALSRARKFLDLKGSNTVSLLITGGLRVSSDFAKAIAMGADAVAVSSAAMMALGCQQYRICDTGKCPLGIATQDPKLRARLDVEKSALRVHNFFKVSTEELQEFARLTGNDCVHKMSTEDLCTTNSEISNHTEIQHV